MLPSRRIPRAFLATLCLLPLVLLAATGPDAEAQERESPSALDTLEKALTEVTRELALLESEIGVEKRERDRAERGLTDLQEFIRKELGPAVGFRTGRVRPELDGACPDPRRIRTRVAALLRDIPEIEVIFPERAYRVSEDGGIVLTKKAGRVTVVYLDPKAAPKLAEQPLEECLDAMRSIWKRTFTDLHKMVEAYAQEEQKSQMRGMQIEQMVKETGERERSRNASETALREEIMKLEDRCRQRESELEAAARKLADQQDRAATLEAENAKLKATVEKLETALEILRRDK